MMTIKAINKVLCGARVKTWEWDGVDIDRRIWIGGVRHPWELTDAWWVGSTLKFKTPDGRTEGWGAMQRDQVH